MVLVIIFFPSIYFSSRLVSNNKTQAVPNDDINGENQADNNSVFKDNTHSTRQTNRDNTGNAGGFHTIIKDLCTIIKNKVFVFSALSLSTLFFIITAVQYWGSDYIEQALKVKDKNIILLSFSVVCVTSPTLGVIIGGWTSSLIGGYESKHSILLCLIYAIFAGLFSLPITYTDEVLEFTIYLWLVLFFGGAIVPVITGIIISSVSNNLRGVANSLTSFLCNLLGYLPAPFIYGIINNISIDSNNRLAFFIVMNYSFLGVFFLCLASYFRYKNFDLNNYNNRASLLGQSGKNITSHRASILSDNLQKIFGGSYVNFNDVDDASRENESPNNNSETNNSVIHNQSNQNETLMTLNIQTASKTFIGPESGENFTYSDDNPNKASHHSNILVYNSSSGCLSEPGKNELQNEIISSSFKNENFEEFTETFNKEGEFRNEKFYSVCSDRVNVENEKEEVIDEENVNKASLEISNH